MKKMKFNLLLLILAIIVAITGCTHIDDTVQNDAVNDMPIIEKEGSNVDENDSSELSNEDQIGQESDQAEEAIDEFSSYTELFDLAEYIHTYNKLPSNFITKSKATELGWKNEEGNLWDVTAEMSIGGDKFGNREGLLPKKEGRIYYECDVNYEGGYRGAERIVFSNDGLIFYTDDHYESFTQLY